MSFRRNSLIFHQDLVDKFTLVDVGASGEMVEPWASLDAAGLLTVIGFEPEEQACSKLNEGSHRYLPFALWKEDGEIPLHVGSQIATSSVHKPNWPVIEKFDERHGAPRRTASVARVKATTLDRALAGDEVDFIKIDTQGAEYEILSGATQALKSALGCTLETWTLEIHEGQRLTEELMGLMRGAGYRLFEIERSAEWQRRGGFRKNRGELVGVDLLYFNSQPRDLLKCALLADLWGYRAFAAELLLEDGSPEAKHLLEQLERLDRRTLVRPQGRLGRVLDTVLPRLLPIRPSVPRVH